MKVRQIMQKELVTILPTTTIHDAALKMKEQKIGSIIVTEEGGNLKGIVTDRDMRDAQPSSLLSKASLKF